VKEIKDCYRSEGEVRCLSLLWCTLLSWCTFCKLLNMWNAMTSEITRMLWRVVECLILRNTLNISIVSLETLLSQ